MDSLDLEAFAHVVAHDLGAPIRGLSINLRLLARELEQGDTDAAAKRMDLLQQRLRKMDEMLRRIRLFSKVHVAGEGESDIHVLVPEALEHVEKRDAQIRMNGATRVKAPPLLVLTILQELLRNAIEHHDGRPDIDVDIQEGQVTITDDGPGIADVEGALAVFGSTRDHLDGGSGLALCRYIARHLGGELEVVSEGRGVRATLRLPT